MRSAFTLNKGMMADPDLEKFKVWPTQADRNQMFCSPDPKLNRKNDIRLVLAEMGSL